MTAYLVAVEGLDAITSLDEIPAKVRRAARAAVNKATDRARTASAREIRQQINFPARYLDPSEGRLFVSQKATNNNLEAKITGRLRPTSLARFARGNPQPGDGAGVAVQVSAGGATRNLPRAFVIRLRAGSAALDTKSNLGLAIRTKNGEPPRGAYKPTKLGQNLWLLYGPSVAQVFKSVRSDVAPDTADFLEKEFLRLMDLESF